MFDCHGWFLPDGSHPNNLMVSFIFQVLFHLSSEAHVIHALPVALKHSSVGESLLVFVEHSGPFYGPFLQ